MKRFPLFKLAGLVAGLVLSVASVASGQAVGAGSLGLDFPLLCKLSGDVTAFSAKADVQVFDKNQKETMSAPMDFALLDNKIRVEMDSTKLKNKDVPAEVAAMMKQLGMDRIVSLVRPDKKAIYIIMPGQQSLANMPMPAEDVASFQAKPKIEKTVLGKETLDGHPCVKNKVVFTSEKGETRESTVWYATDLKNFPLQVLSKEKDDTVIIRYKQVQFTKPDAKQFDVPVGYEEFNDVKAMMMAVTMKLMNNAGAPETK